MKIRAGYDIAFNCLQEVPMLLMLSIHPSRQQDLLTDHVIQFSPNVQARNFRDAFGNVCTRLVAPPGLIQIRNEFLVADSGLPDEINVRAEQRPVGDLPDEALRYLLGSRYCDTQKLSDQAWTMFGGSRAAFSGFRRFATTFMIESNSDTTMPGATGPRQRGMRNGPAFVATSPTWRSHFAAA